MVKNKPIYVDGIDVSDCMYYISQARLHCGYEHDCVDNPNCYYKQLARKTQLEERLIKQIQTICDFINNRPEIFKGICGDVDKIITDYAERKEQECEELKEQLKEMNEVIRTETTRCSLVNSLKTELDQLKRENDRLNTLKDETYFKLKEEYTQQLDQLTVAYETYKKKFQEFFNTDNQECWNAAFLQGEKAKAEQKLEKIREVAKQMVSECIYDDFECKDCGLENGCTYFNKGKILQIIDEE